MIGVASPIAADYNRLHVKGDAAARRNAGKRPRVA